MQVYFTFKISTTSAIISPSAIKIRPLTLTDSKSLSYEHAIFSEFPRKV